MTRQQQYFADMRRRQQVYAAYMIQRMQAAGAGKDVAKEQDQPDPWGSDSWANLVLELESGSMPSGMAVGGSISNASTYMYNANNNSRAPFTWRILGKDLSIPEYVKYRRVVGDGYKRIYVKSIDSNGLHTISTGDATYVRDFAADTYTSTGKTVASISGSFTYGNLNTYNVPASITVDGDEYTFAGYNLTLDSTGLLYIDTTNYKVFDDTKTGYQYGRNCWAISDLRAWMSGNLTTRFTGTSGDAAEFTKYVVPCVNRTWVYPEENYRTAIGNLTDGSICVQDSSDYYSITSDKFWLLGSKNMNVVGSWFKDNSYDTSVFSGVFSNVYNTDDQSGNIGEKNIKYLMDSTGSVGSSAGGWWLRSAYTNDSSGVGDVYDDGCVYSGNASNSYGAVAPAVLIG